MKKDLESQLFYGGFIIGAAGIIVGLVYYFILRNWLPAFPCVFKTMFGIYCPGCGGTRAVIALLKGHVIRALWYHPLVPYAAVIGGGFMITQALHRIGIKRVCGWKFHRWYLYGAVILIGCNFLIKNMLLLIWGITM